MTDSTDYMDGLIKLHAIDMLCFSVDKHFEAVAIQIILNVYRQSYNYTIIDKAD